jgi:uncharacterized protein
MTSEREGRTCILIDGENIDATLGTNIYKHRPAPDERPRWERLLRFSETVWKQPTLGLFFLNASSGTMPVPFVQALLAIGYRVIPLAGPPDVKVVDVGIQRTLEAIKERRDDVMLVSHDADFEPYIREILGAGHRVAVLGFHEFVSGAYADLKPLGLTVYDLEDDVRAFTHALPRTRVIDIDDFDPVRFLE